MRRLKAIGLFWWDFVIGDDWIMAAGILVALGVAAALAHSGIAAWWVLPPAVAGVLWFSLRRAVTPGQ